MPKRGPIGKNLPRDNTRKHIAKRADRQNIAKKTWYQKHIPNTHREKNHTGHKALRKQKPTKKDCPGDPVRDNSLRKTHQRNTIKRKYGIDTRPQRTCRRDNDLKKELLPGTCAKSGSPMDDTIQKKCGIDSGPRRTCQEIMSKNNVTPLEK